MRIVDPTGKWYMNTAQYSFTDYDSMTVFQPGELTKATPTKWIASQSFMVEQQDPTKPLKK